LRLPGAYEDFPFGESVGVYKVGGKMFAILDADSVSLKCDPGYAMALREQYPAVTPGYHLNKRHWNSVRLDGSVPGEALEDWIEESYGLVVAGLPRAQRPVPLR
jgi:predicted DNA-binding protein (MmcQ/YjbR family)